MNMSSQQYLSDTYQMKLRNQVRDTRGDWGLGRDRAPNLRTLPSVFR